MVFWASRFTHNSEHAMRRSDMRYLLLILGMICAGCAQVPPSSAPASAPAAAAHPTGHAYVGIQAPQASTEVANALITASDRKRQDELFGLHFESLRVNGDGLLIDFRYRVTDPEKAKHVVNRQTQPVLIEPVSKVELRVPHAQNVGTLRQTGTSLITGRRYVALFANPGRTIKSGNKVSIVMGRFRLDDVVVE